MEGDVPKVTGGQSEHSQVYYIDHNLFPPPVAKSKHNLSVVESNGNTKWDFYTHVTYTCTISTHGNIPVSPTCKASMGGKLWTEKSFVNWKASESLAIQSWSNKGHDTCPQSLYSHTYSYIGDQGLS